MTAVLKFDLTARAFAVALLATVVVLAGAMWFLAIGPRRSDASKLEATIRTKQAQLLATQHRRTAARAAQRRQLGEVQTAMPDELAMPQVVDDLNHLAAQAGVSLDTVTPAPPVAGSGYDAVPVTVVVDGRFFAVERFLHLVRTQVQVEPTKLEARGRLFSVEGVQLEQAEPAPNVTATFTVKTFYYTGQAVPVTTTAPANATTTAPSN